MIAARAAHRTRAVLVAVAGALLVAGCSGGGSPIPPGGGSSPGATSPGQATLPVSSPRGPVAGCPVAPPPALAAGQTRTVTISTAKGTIIIAVKADLGPNAAGNFVALAGCGFYDGLVFHRLVPGFVIQGGDPNGDGTGGPGYAIADDPVSVAYSRGTVAMANAGPNTGGSQFFIVLADAQLDPSYPVFGTVTSGMDVVDAIAAMPNSGGTDNRALQPVAMDHVTVTNP